MVYPYHCNIKRLPGDRNPSEFRLEFRSNPAERAQSFTLKGDGEVLRNFLISKLHQDTSVASRVAAEVLTNGSAFCERLPFQPEEIPALIRDLEVAHRRAAQNNIVIDYAQL